MLVTALTDLTFFDDASEGLTVPRGTLGRGVGQGAEPGMIVVHFEDYGVTEVELGHEVQIEGLKH